MPSALHEALQRFYAGDDGRVEVEMDGFYADAIRDGVIYEIQTGSFTAIRDKLHALANEHPVVLVHPIARFKWIAKFDGETGEETSYRRSPKRSQLCEVFNELVYATRLLSRENITLELVVIAECEMWLDDGNGSWRRKGQSIIGHECLAILERHRFEEPADLARLLPEGLPEQFTVADIRECGGIRQRLAGRIAYTLREVGAIEQVGKQGRAYLYERAKEQP
ncbi:MAG: hypothetical protein GX131_00690 [candidate division WS1 bacterium]|jgi:hypothetical protein|nr:hypothetical protein [candidate division WS1 bacterium]